jgi:hypothetical protein
MRQKLKLEKWIAKHPRLWGITISMLLFCLAYWSGIDIGRYLWIAIFLSVFFGGLYYVFSVGIKALKNRQWIGGFLFNDRGSDKKVMRISFAA